MNPANIVDGLIRGIKERLTLDCKNFEEESDWDFLIFVKGNLDLKGKRELMHKIYRRFHDDFLSILVDMILKDKQSFVKYRLDSLYRSTSPLFYSTYSIPVGSCVHCTTSIGFMPSLRHWHLGI